ncbi:autophagy protein 12-like [Uloborus diversus]|uniref:autophagy protein 12-like n=1 Tax=Uloborus diversus TaxID=327109 RepID=UPI002409B199|nr:autophagy protein 12-like [Uloborus diversus]
MAGVVEEITIKKEIEDSSDIPDQGETPDSSNTQIDSSGNQKHTKVTIWLKPTGNAPIIKIKKWTVDKDTPLANIMGFLKQYMKLESTASVFLYVNQAFAPSPDHEVGNVYDCFNINGKLVLHYSTSPAWG